jgi:hypothetical protein
MGKIVRIYRISEQISTVWVYYILDQGAITTKKHMNRE